MVVDEFGLKEIYRSSSLKQKYFSFPMRVHQVDVNFLQANVFWDGTLISASNEASPDEIFYWTLQDFNNPIFIFTSQFGVFPGPNCSLNHTAAINQGFAYAETDWQNVEITGHFYILKRPTSGSSEDKSLFQILARTSAHSDDNANCCSFTGYGTNLLSAKSNDVDGSMNLFKVANQSNVKALTSFRAGSIVNQADDFMFQKWVGIKFIVRNVKVQGQEQVYVELYLSPSDQPKDFENWILIYRAVDYAGGIWTDIGTACNSPQPHQPITFGNIYCQMATNPDTIWNFKNFSIREIESFEEQVQNPPGGNDPIPPGGGGGGGGGDTNPPPDTEPPPGTEPPDVPTPPTPTIVQKRLTIKREILSNAFCQCEGVPDTGPPGGGGSGGGGGTGGGGGGGGGSGGGGGGGGSGGSLQTIYNVSPSGAGYAKLASVSTNRDDFYLRFGQIVSQSNSVFIGKKIGRIQIFLAEEDRPRGGTGGGVHCRIRKGSDDSIAATLLPIAKETDLHDAGSWFVFSKLDNTYAMQLNDKILFEYDGGDNNDYAKVFRKSGQPNTGSKTVHRNNLQSAGTYSTSSRDMCMRVYSIEGTLNPDTSDT